MKSIEMVIIALIMLAVTVSSAFAIGTLSIHLHEVEIDRQTVYPEPDHDDDVEIEDIILEAGDIVQVKVDFWSSKSHDDLRIESFLAGNSVYQVDRPTSYTVIEDFEDDHVYTRRLAVKIPEDIAPGDYTIILSFSTDEATYLREYDVEVERPSRGVSIADIDVTPDGPVKGGRTVALRMAAYNFGAQTENVLLRADINGLNVDSQVTTVSVTPRATEYTDTLYFTLPLCAPSGIYKLRGLMEYANGLKRDVFLQSIEVADNSDCGLFGDPQELETVTFGRIGERTLIRVPPPQNAQQGGGEATYHIEILNKGTQAKSYHLDIGGADSWAMYTVNPSNLVVVQSGSSVVASIALRAKDSAPVGAQQFTVDVRSSDKVLEQVTLVANVVNDASQGYSGDSAMAGVTANVVKRSSGGGSGVSALSSLLTTFLVTVIIIGAAVFYFSQIRSDPRVQYVAPPEEVKYYDTVYPRREESFSSES